MSEWLISGDLLEIVKITCRVLVEEPSLSQEPFRLACRVQERLPSSVRKLLQESMPSPSPLPEGEPVRVATTRELLTKVKEALQNGLQVYSSDAPLHRCIGYQVFEGGVAIQYLHIGLHLIRESYHPSQLGGLGVDPQVLADALKSPRGRAALLDMLSQDAQG